MIDLLSPLRRAATFVLIFSIGVNLLILTVPLYMLQLFDRVVLTRSEDTLILLSAIAVGALVTLAGLDAARVRIMIAIADWLERRMSAEVFLAAFRKTQKNIAATGQELRDLSVVRGFISGTGLFPVVDAPWVIIFSIMIFFIHPLLGWISVIGALLLIGVAVLNELGTKTMWAQANDAVVDNTARAESMMADADAVNAMGLARGMILSWAEHQNIVWDRLAQSAARNGDLTALAKFLRLLLQVSILGAGAWLAMIEAITPGAMIAASIIMGRAVAPIEQSLGGWRMMGTAREAWKRLVVLMEHAPKANEAPIKMPQPKGRLLVDRLIYAPPGVRDPILNGLSFGVNAGESLAIVGPSGSGKTTLARLLVGALRPSVGDVMLDGVPIADWDGDDKGKYFGYVPQTVVLPSAKIRDIIGRFGGADETHIVAAARMADCHDFIVSKPDGYDTVVGASGVALSGGERQRIALARAVIGSPRLLVMDEPNTYLDTEGEAALMRTIATLKKSGATVIMVAHRPSALRFVDKMLVLRDGKAIQFGNLDEVLPQVTRTAGRAPAPIERQPK